MMTRTTRLLGALALVCSLGCGGGDGGGDGGGGSGTTHPVCDAVTNAPTSCAAQQFATRDVCEAQYIIADSYSCQSEVDAWVNCLATHDAPAGSLDCAGCEAQSMAAGTCLEP